MHSQQNIKNCIKGISVNECNNVAYLKVVGKIDIRSNMIYFTNYWWPIIPLLLNLHKTSLLWFFTDLNLNFWRSENIEAYNLTNKSQYFFFFVHNCWFVLTVYFYYQSVLKLYKIKQMLFIMNTQKLCSESTLHQTNFISVPVSSV